MELKKILGSILLAIVIIAGFLLLRSQTSAQFNQSKSQEEPALQNPVSTSTDLPITPTQAKATTIPEGTTIPQFLPNVTKTHQLPTESSPSEYEGPPGRVTILMPPKGRFIILGDSISYGSTMQGNDTYEDICENRWPYVEQIAIETGFLSTASLDRGDSMKTPFYTEETVFGKIIEYCDPPPETPLLSTAVPGSNTSEWINELLSYSVIVKSLQNPDNPVVMFLIGADIFAEKIGKEPIDVNQYEQNVGKIIQMLSSYEKVIYIGMIPHVQAGSFISEDDLESTNAKIDEFNTRLKSMIELNGYTNNESEEWIDFGEQTLNQDNLTIWATTLQKGPDLATVSDTIPDEDYAKDGLHFHPEGYNIIGHAWGESLKNAIRITRLED